MTTKTDSAVTAKSETLSGKGQTSVEGAKASVSLSETAMLACNQIGGNCETAIQCCAAIQEKFKACANMPDADSEWNALQACLESCMGTCETTCETFGVAYSPTPTVLVPV